jgi:hypothetical protein
MQEGAGNGTCLLKAVMDDGGVGEEEDTWQKYCTTEQVENAKLGI